MYLDILVGIIILFTVYKGYSSGFFISLLSFFGIVVSLVSAKEFTPKLMSLLRIGEGEVIFSMIYMVFFLVAYLLIGILLAFLESFIKVNKRTAFGIVLGSGFGFMKGVALVFVMLLFYNLLGDNINIIKEYGEQSKVNTIFKNSFPYTRDILPKRIGNNIDSKRYENDIEKYLKSVLKESGK